MSKIKKMWNIFLNRDPTEEYNLNNYQSYTTSMYEPMNRLNYFNGNNKSIVSAVLNRIAVDASGVEINHIQQDENDRFLEIINSDLDYCFNTSSNSDQNSRIFKHDIVYSMLDEGVIAVVPVSWTTSVSEYDGLTYGVKDISSLRVARITQWYTDRIKVEIYNENTGTKTEKTVLKSEVAIIENPFYSVMNSPNSTMQRLRHKLTLLDSIDEMTASGKLDIIIQLPYATKSKIKQNQAAERRKELAQQLKDSTYGVGYIDHSEKITQLNRPLENNLLKQIEYLTDMAYGELGVNKEILNGTAGEETMNNYYSRMIEPILDVIVQEIKRKFLTREQIKDMNQSVSYFIDYFKFIPITKLSDFMDKATRSEVLSTNDIRQVIRFKPSSDPKADELRNTNMPYYDDGSQYENYEEGVYDE